MMPKSDPADSAAGMCSGGRVGEAKIGGSLLSVSSVIDLPETQRNTLGRGCGAGSVPVCQTQIDNAASPVSILNLIMPVDEEAHLGHEGTGS